MQLILDQGFPLERTIEFGLQREQRRIAVRELRRQFVAPQHEPLELFLHARETRFDGSMGRTPRLHLEPELARGILRSARRGARRDQIRAQPLARSFEFDALRLERGHRLDRGFHAAARRMQIDIGALERGLHLGKPGLQLREPPRMVLRTRTRRIESGAPVQMLAMQPIDVGLQSFAPVFLIAQAVARRSLLSFEFGEIPGHARDRGAQFTQRLFALDHPLARIVIAGDAQPIGAQPDAFACDDGLARPQARAPCERILQRVRGIDGREQRSQYRGSADFRLQ